MKDNNDFSDLGAIPADDFSDLGAVPAEQHQNLLQKIGSNVTSSVRAAEPVVSGANDIASSLLESGLDAAKGVGQGISIGAADELGAIPMTALEALYNRFNPTDSKLREQGFKIDQPGLADLYRKNQKDIQHEFDTASENSPWLYGAGNIAGGLTSGSAIGGMLGIGGEAAAGAPKLLDIARNEGKLKALGELGLRGLKTYKQALPTMLAEGALSSKEGGVLNPEERGQLAQDVAGTALFGLPAVMGLQAVTEVASPLARETADKLKGKVQGMVEDSPLLRQMKVSYDYGTQGINPKSQKAQLDTTLGKTSLAELDNKRTSEILNEIQGAQNRIGEATRQSLVDATSAGKFIDIAPEVKDSLSQVAMLADKYPEIASNPRARDIYGKILANPNAKVSPLEAKDLIDYMDAYIGKFKAATNKTPADEGILSNLYTTRKQFANTLQTQIPEYGAAAERYANFMNLVPETIIAKGKPVDIKDQYFGNLNKGDEKLFDAIKQLNQGTTKEGAATAPVREAFVQSMKGLKTFEQQEAQRLAAGTIKESALQRPASAIEDMIKKNSDDAVARGAMDALDPHTGVSSTMAKVVTGTGDTGRAIALGGANLAGRLKTPLSSATTMNPIAKMSRAIYNAPHETVTALAGKLKNQPGLEKYGQNLEHALQSPDTNKRNQVLFTIMQNPSARAFVDQDSQEPQE